MILMFSFVLKVRRKHSSKLRAFKTPALNHGAHSETLSGYLKPQLAQNPTTHCTSPVCA